MSRITLEPNNSGTGTFTVAAPNSNNNRTFDLPDEDGVVLTDSTDLEPQVKTSLNATGDAPMFACRAFVNFDGTGTVSIRESGNVSSITDNGTGNYTVNFATAMPDNNYFAVFQATATFTSANGQRAVGRINSYATSSLDITCSNFSDDNLQDTAFGNVAIFR